MITGRPILRIAQNGNIDLVHRFFVDLISTRRVNPVNIFTNIYNFSNYG
jgi:hypothetical protein